MRPTPIFYVVGTFALFVVATIGVAFFTPEEPLGGDEELPAEKVEPLKTDADLIIDARTVPEKISETATKTRDVVQYMYYEPTVTVPVQKMSATKSELEAKLSDKKVDYAVVYDKPDEIIASRTPVAEYYNVGKTKKEEPIISAKLYTSETYYKLNDEWHVIEYATTSPSSYDAVMFDTAPLSRFKKFFSGERVNAACGDSGGSCYSLAGDGTVGCPFAGSPATETLRRNSSTCDNPSTGDISYTATTNKMGQAELWNYYHGYLTFDTSGISGTVTAANLHMFYSSGSGRDDAVYVTPGTASSKTRLVWGDYLKYTRTEDLYLTTTGVADGGEIDLSFAAGNLDMITTGTTTKFTLMMNSDYANTDSGGTNRYELFRMSEYADTATDPYLVVTYTAGGGSSAPTTFIYNSLLGI